MARHERGLSRNAFALQPSDWHDKENTKSLLLKVPFGISPGIVAGLALNLLGMNASTRFINARLVDNALYVVGAMFVNALKRTVMPPVRFSLIIGPCGISSVQTLGRTGTTSFVPYLLTTMVDRHDRAVCR